MCLKLQTFVLPDIVLHLIDLDIILHIADRFGDKLLNIRDRSERNCFPQHGQIFSLQLPEFCQDHFLIAAVRFDHVKPVLPAVQSQPFLQILQRIWNMGFCVDKKVIRETGSVRHKPTVPIVHVLIAVTDKSRHESGFLLRILKFHDQICRKRSFSNICKTSLSVVSPFSVQVPFHRPVGFLTGRLIKKPAAGIAQQYHLHSIDKSRLSRGIIACQKIYIVEFDQLLRKGIPMDQEHSFQCFHADLPVTIL